MTRFRHLEIERPVAPPTPEEIGALEEALGSRLPDDFAEFLRAANGGAVDYSFDHADGDEVRPLCFYSVHSTRLPVPGRPAHGRFLSELESERRLRGIPPRVLPFATDGGASVVYLDLTDEGRGRVLGYVEGLSGWDGTPESGFVVLAPDFESFVRGLYLNLEEEPKHAG